MTFPRAARRLRAGVKGSLYFAKENTCFDLDTGAADSAVRLRAQGKRQFRQFFLRHDGRFFVQHDRRFLLRRDRWHGRR